MGGLQTILSLFSIKLKYFRSIIVRFYLLYYTKTSLKLCFLRRKCLDFAICCLGHQYITLLNMETTSGLSVFTHKVPITTAADDKFCDIFLSFQQK